MFDEVDEGHGAIPSVALVSVQLACTSCLHMSLGAQSFTPYGCGEMPLVKRQLMASLLEPES